MTPVSNVSPTVTTPQAESTADRVSLSNDFDDFLLLLTTQLQNQDPLSPMDSTEFTNQLVQFSNVEQQIKSNEYLENLLTMQTLNLTALGLSYIGKDVEVAGETFETTGGTNVDMSYDMPNTASSSTLTIKDENGNTVFTQAADLTAGLHKFTWNGMNQSGNPVPAGEYTINISALDSENVSLNVITYVPGHVDSLESSEDGSLMLGINGQQIPITDVRKVSQASM